MTNKRVTNVSFFDRRDFFWPSYHTFSVNSVTLPERPDKALEVLLDTGHDRILTPIVMPLYRSKFQETW